MGDIKLQATLGLDLEEFDRELARLTSGFQENFAAKAAPAVQRVSGAMKDVGESTGQAREKLADYGATMGDASLRAADFARWLTTAVSIAAGATAFVKLADEFTMLQARLAIASQGLGSASEAYRQVFEIAQATRTPLAETVTLYTRFADAAKATGTAQEAMAVVMRTVAQAMAVGGGSAESMRAALVQLGQGMASGVLRGEELNSVFEQAPRLAKALAEGLDVPIGALRQMGAQGELTSARVISALQAASASVERDFAKMPATIGGAFTQISNATLNLVGTFDRASGASSLLARALVAISENMDAVLAAGAALAATGLVAFLTSSTWAAGLLAGAIAALSAPVVLVTAGVAALAGGLYVLWNRMREGKEDIGAARTELAELREALERQPNNLMLKQHVRDQRELVAALELRIQTEREAAGQMRGLAALQRQTAEEERNRMTAMAAAQSVMAKLNGVNEDFRKNLTVLHRAYETGGLSIDAYRDLVGKLITAQGGVAKATKETKDSTEKAAEAAARLRTSLLDEVSALEMSRAGAGKLTDAQKLMLKVGEALRDNKVQLTAEEKRGVFGRLEAIAAADALARREDELLKLGQASLAAESKRIDTLRQTVEKLRDENAALGLSGAALAQVNIAKQETVLLDLRRKALIPELSAAELGAIEAQIRLQEQLVALMRDGAVRRESIAAADAAAKAWDTAAQQMGQSLTDWIMSGGKNARDYVVGLFRSAVLTPLLRPVMTSLSGAVGTALGLAPTGAAAAGGAGNLGLLGSLGSAIGGFGSYFSTGLGYTLGGGSLGTALGSAGELIGGGQVLGGIGTGLGALAPYLAGAAAIYALVKSFGGGETRYGAQYGLDPAGRAFKIEGPSGGDPKAAEVMASIEAANRAMQAAISGFGGAGEAFAITRAGYELSEKSGKRFSEIFVNGAGRRQYGFESNEAVGAAFGADLQRAVLLGLQQADLAAPFAAYFRSVDAFALEPAQVESMLAAANAAQAMAQATAGLGGVFLQISGASVEARTNILALTGGLDAFTQKVGGYVSAFYSAEEQAALQAATVARALAGAGLDLTGLDTRAEFRAMVDSLDISTDTGQAQLAALLNVAQGFAGLTDYMAEQGLTLEELAAMAPVDRLAEITMSGQATQQTQLAEISSQLASLESAFVGAVGASAGAIGAAVSGAVRVVADRPVQVILHTPEVNGGVV